MRSIICLAAVSIICLTARGQSPVKDGVVPQASEPIKSLLDRTDQQLKANQYPAALSGANAALTAAKRVMDGVGEAMAGRERARALAGLRRFDDALKAWTEDAGLWKSASDGPGQVEALANQAILTNVANSAEARNLIDSAVSIVKLEQRRPVQAVVELVLAAEAAYNRDLPILADRLARAALPIIKNRKPDAIEIATCLNMLGDVATDSGEETLAKSDFVEARAIEQPLPFTIDTIETMNGFGSVEELLNHFKTARDYYEQSRALAKKMSRKKAEAQTLIELGNVSRKQHFFDEAIADYSQAKTILERRWPGSIDVAACETDLGVVDSDRGDDISAEREFSDALKLDEDLQFPVDAARSKANLALVDFDRGNLKRSRERLQEALKVFESHNPKSPDMAATLIDLGNIAMEQGDLDAAEADYRGALGIDKRITPRSFDTAGDLISLGHVLAEEGKAESLQTFPGTDSTRQGYQLSPKYSEANQFLDQALAILPFNPTATNFKGVIAMYKGGFKEAAGYFRKAMTAENWLEHDSLASATYLGNLANVETLAGNLDQADKDFAAAKTVAERSPNSMNMARILTDIGELRLRQGQPKAALDSYLRASEVMEAQRRQIEGPEARRLFGDAFTAGQQGLAKAYIALNQPVSAFNAVEEDRGRILADRLFENRNIDDSREVPSSFRERQRKLDNDQEIAFREVGRYDPRNPNETAGFAKAEERYHRCLIQQRDLEEEIRHTSPHYANLRYPPAFNLEAVQHTLDNGSLLLYYFVSDQTVYLFTVTNRSFRYYPLSVSRVELELDTKKFFDSLAVEMHRRDPEVAIKLYTELLSPARGEVDAARRLLISPDKVLWRLPFCALIDNGNPNIDECHYLVESKPIHYVLSMSVYAELLSDRNRSVLGLRPMVAFGDPAYSSSENASSLGGMPFKRVLITGSQVRRISAMYGTRPILGAEVTRARVLKEAPHGKIVHFALHGVADVGSDPFSSFLAMAPERPKDGFSALDAYTVIESLKLNAELVTLGACDTGLGQVSNAEGVMGLTRAFQYAGAHSVLCTLWNIDANSASELLSGLDPRVPDETPSSFAATHCFYGAFKAGQSKDEALCSAQILLLRHSGNRFRDPRFWAAFALQGDWK